MAWVMLFASFTSKDNWTQQEILDKMAQCLSLLCTGDPILRDIGLQRIQPVSEAIPEQTEEPDEPEIQPVPKPVKKSARTAKGPVQAQPAQLDKPKKEGGLEDTRQAIKQVLGLKPKSTEGVPTQEVQKNGEVTEVTPLPKKKTGGTWD